MIVLQRITPTLATSLKKVRLTALQEAPSAFGSTYEAESRFSEAEWRARASAMSLDNAVGYLAFENEQPCGIVRGSLDQANPQRAHITSMWVKPEYRRAGLATQLLNAVQSWASHAGVRELVLTVTDNNQAAIALYSSHGFQPTGRTEPYPNNQDLFESEMRKPLR